MGRTDIVRFQPRSMPRSEAPFAQVVIDDRYAFLAGLVAADFPEGAAVLGDISAETHAVMQMIESILAELRLGMDSVVRAEVHLATLDDFDAMDSAYRQFFAGGEFPARTTTQSDKLFGGSLVEVTCQARLTDSSGLSQ
jgi:2-iminobutanoate/2-iminopropanoate deaminase